MNIACIGAGYWGKNLIRNFDAIGSLYAICDGDIGRLEDFAKQYPPAKTYNSLSDVLADSSVDAVSIATPAETHADIMRAALEAGKHVYVEKPLCLDEAEGQAIIELAEEKGLTLMVGHLLQYHPVFIKIKQLLADKTYGDLRYVYSNRLNMGLLRKEENVLWSFAPHDISMILGLVGSMPTDISATGSTYLTEGVADVVTANMKFDHGVNAHVFVSWLNPFKEQKLTVVCEKGMLVFDDTLPWEQKLSVYEHSVTWADGMPKAEKAEVQLIQVEQSEPLKDECLHFIESIKTGNKPRTDGEEGLNVLHVLNQIQDSLDS